MSFLTFSLVQANDGDESEGQDGGGLHLVVVGWLSATLALMSGQLSLSPFIGIPLGGRVRAWTKEHTYDARST